MTALVFSGSGSYSIAGTSATITVPKIVNNTNGGHSGSVKVALWLFNTPYTGGSQVGYDVAEVTNYTTTLNGNGGYYNSQTVTVAFTSPPSGTYYPALLLQEYSGSSYVTDNSLTFTNTVKVGGGASTSNNDDRAQLVFRGGAAYVTSPSTGTVSISVPEIDNTSSSATSGSVKVELWFFNAPYTGASQTGFNIGTVSNYKGQLGPNSYYSGQTVTVTYAPPPTGTYYASLLLEDYANGSYQVDSYLNFNGTSNAVVSTGSAAGNGIGTTGGDGTPINSASLALYRFFDRSTGTQFLTSSSSERNSVIQNQSSRYAEENAGFSSANSTDRNLVTVYRLFDTRYGTHFYTSDAAELASLTTSGTTSYRSDLIYESTSSFYEHSTLQANDTAVHRFFQKATGTHFYTGSDTEYAGLVTKGNASYRADFVDEGISFYAPKALT